MAAFTEQMRLSVAPERARRRREQKTRTPEEALRRLISEAEVGPRASGEIAVIVEPDSAMAHLCLAYADRARAAGVEMRMIFAQRRPAWGWRRSAAPAAAFELIGPRRMRFLDGAEARRYYNQAVFSDVALWTGPRIGRSRFASWSGRFSGLQRTARDERRAARAQASFEAVWRVARIV